MKINLHTHTKRCLHANGSEEDYVNGAIQAGVTTLGFSDHAPFPDYDFGFRMKYAELNDYLKCIDTLSHKYSNKIQLYKGLEIEYLPQYNDFYKELIDNHMVDYLLLGQHMFTTKEKSFFYGDIKESKDCVEYAKVVCEAMKTGFFSIFAHPDIFMMNVPVWDENCETAADMILETAKETNIILECNANGIRRGLFEYDDVVRYQYPDHRFWQKVANTSLPVIVGSDCHSPELMWDNAVITAYEFLDKLGMKPLLEYTPNHYK